MSYGENSKIVSLMVTRMVEHMTNTIKAVESGELNLNNALENVPMVDMEIPIKTVNNINYRQNFPVTYQNFLNILHDLSDADQVVLTVNGEKETFDKQMLIALHSTITNTVMTFAMGSVAMLDMGLQNRTPQLEDMVEEDADISRLHLNRAIDCLNAADAKLKEVATKTQDDDEYRMTSMVAELKPIYEELDNVRIYIAASDDQMFKPRQSVLKH